MPDERLSLYNQHREIESEIEYQEHILLSQTYKIEELKRKARALKKTKDILEQFGRPDLWDAP